MGVVAWKGLSCDRSAMDKQPPLFADLPETDLPEARTEAQAKAGADRSAVRVRTPVRNQVELRAVDLDATLKPDHPARAVWAFVEQLDLSALYARIGSVAGRAGRPAIDPRILVALWLYATIDGVGSARQLARLCERHDAYRWICGGVSVNHHTLSDFRVAQEDWLDEQLTRSVAVLMHEGLVQLKRVAQDGMRVRASAGAASFRRGSTLRRCLKQARAQVRRLRRELEDDPGGQERRKQAARARAAQERERRLARALEQLKAIRRLNAKLRGFRVLAGAEVNIRKDGTLDIADDVLARLDVVGAAVHHAFHQPRDEMTRRVIRALENPHVDILFHPTARILGRREPIALDIDAVIAAARRTGTVLEIDAIPDRLDLRDEYARRAVEAGVKLAIDSDAHAPDHLDFPDAFGIAVARRGWVRAEDVVNTRPAADCLALLKDGGRRRVG